MEIIHARKIRIYPNGEQKQKINKTLGCCRYVYNKMLERNKKAYARRKEHIGNFSMQNLLPPMKQYLPWLKEADSQALKYACKQLNTAFDGFFKKRTGFPGFHKKHGRQAYTTTNTKQIVVEPHRLKLPCLKWVKTADSREWNNSYKVCYATISRETDGRYYASVTYKTDIPVTENTGANFIGFDYKSDGLYMDSNGVCADMPHYFRKSQKLLKRRSRQLSKKIGNCKGERKSANFCKLMKRISKIHTHIANQRKDFLHKLSTEIANQYDGVCIEDLNMKAMANKDFGNGKATNDNGWGMFTVMLAYKLKERGKKLVKIDKWFPSSQICNECGHRQKMPLNVRTYHCPVCGNVLDRDHNAAINILIEGMRELESA